MRVPIDFDEADAKIIAYLVEHYDKGGPHVEAKQISSSLEMSRDDVLRILARFSNYDLVEPLTLGGELWSIDPQLLSVADQLGTPPEKDYPREVEKWFRGKWWSIPVQLVFLGLPAIVGYVTMLRTILAWVGVGAAQ